MSRRKSELIITTELCCYGCGNIALFKNCSGKLTCSISSQSCPINRKKNSDGLKRAHIDRPSFYDYNSLSQESKSKMNHNKGKKAENYEPLKRQKENRAENYKNGKFTLPLTGFCIKSELRWRRNYINYIDSFGTPCVLESFYELKVANELDKNGIKWTRPNYFLLSNGKRYEPDFYLIKEQIYLDPKGKWNRSDNKNIKEYQGFSKQKEQLEKIKLFEKEYQVKCLVIFDDKKMKSFEWSNIKLLIESYT